MPSLSLISQKCYLWNTMQKHLHICCQRWKINLNKEMVEFRISIHSQYFMNILAQFNTFSKSRKTILKFNLQYHVGTLITRSHIVSYLVHMPVFVLSTTGRVYFADSTLEEFILQIQRKSLFCRFNIKWSGFTPKVAYGTSFSADTFIQAFCKTLCSRCYSKQCIYMCFSWFCQTFHQQVEIAVYFCQCWYKSLTDVLVHQYVSADMTMCRCIVSAKFYQYISAIFAHKSVTLFLCMECTETQVASSLLTLFD